MLKLNEYWVLTLLILLAVVTLLFPHIVRYLYADNNILGEGSYYHMRIGSELAERGLFLRDSFGAVYRLDPYDVVLALFGSMVPAAANLLPFALGIASVIFLYLVLRRLGIRERLLVVFFWVSSPLFIYTFTVSNRYAVILFLMIAGAYFYLLDSKWCCAFFGLVPLFGITPTVITLIGIRALGRHRTTVTKLAIAIVISIGLVFNLIHFLRYGIMGSSLQEGQNFLQENIVGLGAITGFNVFVLLVAGIGIISSWQHKRRHLWLYVMVVLTLLASWIMPGYKPLLNLGVAVFAAYGVMALFERKWQITIIRNLTILLLMVGIIYSSFNYVQQLSFGGPDKATIHALGDLKLKSNPGEVVLSHFRNGYWIEYFSERPALLTEQSSDVLFNQTKAIFISRNITAIDEFFDGHRITYVYIDNRTMALMKDANNNLGLPFVMENSERFAKVVAYPDIVVYRYQGVTSADAFMYTRNVTSS
jgi:hypothetical protein